MRNYFLTKVFDDKETYNFFKSLSKKELKELLSMKLEDINDYLVYYSKLLKIIFNGTDYNEHNCNLKSLSEEVNDIKIILNILEEDYNE